MNLALADVVHNLCPVFVFQIKQDSVEFVNHIFDSFLQIRQIALFAIVHISQKQVVPLIGQLLHLCRFPAD